MPTVKVVASTKSPVSSYPQSRCSPHGSLLNRGGAVSVALLNLATIRLSTDRVFLLFQEGMSGPSSEVMFIPTFAHSRATSVISCPTHFKDKIIGFLNASILSIR